MTIIEVNRAARRMADEGTAMFGKAARGCGSSVSVFLRDAGHGLLEVSHNMLALLGLVLTGLALFAASRADVRHDAETWTLGWLQARQEARAAPPTPAELLASELSEPDAVTRATAVDPKVLSRQQAAVAQWISRRYRVALEPVSRLVEEAWSVGRKANLDPTLILAIMAVESSFNPFAQSSVGAQGLMQVMTKVHNDKYEAFGGNHAAFDPVTNLRVGAQVLKECIDRAGGVEAGLRYYVGAANLDDDGGYAGKVLSEQATLRVVAGRTPVSRPPILKTVTSAPSTTAAEPKPPEEHAADSSADANAERANAERANAQRVALVR